MIKFFGEEGEVIFGLIVEFISHELEGVEIDVAEFIVVVYGL